MALRSSTLILGDYLGGLNTDGSATSLELNQALDLQNINLLSYGGFEKRRGNGVFNSTAMNSGANVQGLGYFRKSNVTDWLVAVCGAKLFKADNLDGTMDDITGSLTIAAGQNNIWTHSTMNDLSIFVGGAPNAPIKWDGAAASGSALGGTPPNGSFGFMYNNYFFIGNTVSNPSRIQWSVLGNPEDWSGIGSGTQDINKNDGDVLIGAIPLGNDRLILFKQHSMHELIGRNPPFPVFPKVSGIGAVGKQAIVNVDGMIYFVTPEPRMKAFDGYTVYSFPNVIDSVWNGLNKSRLSYIVGFYNQRIRQIWWMCSNGSSSTNDYCIVWDLDQKCWLRNPTGYGMNVVTLAQDRTIYAGAYNGKIYQLDKALTFTDVSETSPAINAYWRSGWHDIGTMIANKIISFLEVNYKTQTTGTLEFGYGFDFGSDRKIVSIDMKSPGGKWNQFQWGIGKWGGQTDYSKSIFIKGKGKFFQYLIKNKNDNEQLRFNRLEFPMKTGNPQVLTAV